VAKLHGDLRSKSPGKDKRGTPETANPARRSRFRGKDRYTKSIPLFLYLVLFINTVFPAGKTQFARRRTDMKKKYGVLSGFAVLLMAAMCVLAGCGDSGGGPVPYVDPFAGFNELLDSLTTGAPGTGGGSNAANVGLSGKNLSSVTGVSTTSASYEGWFYEEDEGEKELWRLWTGAGETDYDAVEAALESLLSITFGATTVNNGVHTGTQTYTVSQKDYECTIVGYEVDTDDEGILVPAGTIVVIFEYVDPFAGFNDLLDSLNTGTFSSGDGATAASNLGLTGGDLPDVTGVTTTSASYEGWHYEEDEGEKELWLLWTGGDADGDDYEAVIGALESLLSITFDEPVESNGVYMTTKGYGVGDYECTIVGYEDDTDDEGILVPAGTILVIFEYEE
jgi:hypothetical protein